VKALLHQVADHVDVEPAIGCGRGVVYTNRADVTVIAPVLKCEELRVEACELPHVRSVRLGRRDLWPPTTCGASYSMRSQQLESSRSTH